MASLVRKMAIVAAPDGVILQPSHHQHGQYGVKVFYESNKITACFDDITQYGRAWECHGIVGFLKVPGSSHLITIASRSQVANFRGSTIYAITEVSIIPLSCQTEAKDVIDQELSKFGRTDSNETSGSDHSDEEHDDDTVRDHVDREYTTINTSGGSSHASSDPSQRNVVEDVIERKGQYGRFAEKWFSSQGWNTEKRRVQGMSPDISMKPPISTERVCMSNQPHGNLSERNSYSIPIEASSKESKAPESAYAGNATRNLLPKLLRTTRMLLASHNFFYSYEVDITRRLGKACRRNSHLSLHKVVDPLFFWNSHLAAPLIDQHHDTFVLPIMQGFVGQRAFRISNKSMNVTHAATTSTGELSQASKSENSAQSEHDHYLTLISRRAVKRPGLRYLRRGIDDEGYTANSVETEQLLSKATCSASDKIYSFTQIRGSIPLFFSQSPYAFKPVPILHQSTAANEAAFSRHFRMLQEMYGSIQITLLVDKMGGEAEIGRQYEESTQKFNANVTTESERLNFEWFDFHDLCRGMKFERVNLLMDAISDKLTEFGHTVEVNGRLEAEQTGIVRTNCMDCLDRTNVAQSACGQRALEAQLKSEGMDIDLRTDPSTQWFNTLWADNGDAISKQYSSTAALKGDFTRTRRRNYRGAFNDLGLTLTRYYNNLVNDYFSQAAIDYLLGVVTSQVFEDFEDRMMSSDPGVSMQKVRENAINTSSKIVIEDGGEELIGGWTLLSPRRANTVKSWPIEEAVLLLTDEAIYRICYDWNSEKVVSFERVDVRNIISIIKGTYITSALTYAQKDEAKNIGFLMQYQAGGDNVSRKNTRTLISDVPDDINDRGIEAEKHDHSESLSDTKILAFKALPSRSIFVAEGNTFHAMSEQELISSICEDIQRIVFRCKGSQSGFIQEREIVSLGEARKSTGLVEQWGHSLKRAIWG